MNHYVPIYSKWIGIILLKKLFSILRGIIDGKIRPEKLEEARKKIDALA